jgi:hypothetical protein
LVYQELNSRLATHLTSSVNMTVASVTRGSLEVTTSHTDTAPSTPHLRLSFLLPQPTVLALHRNSKNVISQSTWDSTIRLEPKPFLSTPKFIFLLPAPYSKRQSLSQSKFPVSYGVRKFVDQWGVLLYKTT